VEDVVEVVVLFVVCVVVCFVVLFAFVVWFAVFFVVPIVFLLLDEVFFCSLFVPEEFSAFVVVPSAESELSRTVVIADMVLPSADVPACAVSAFSALQPKRNRHRVRTNINTFMKFGFCIKNNPCHTDRGIQGLFKIHFFPSCPKDEFCTAGLPTCDIGQCPYKYAFSVSPMAFVFISSDTVMAVA